MTAFDQAWSEIGQSCNACGAEHYNQSDFCSKCGQTEQKLRESGAYRRPAKDSLKRTIDRLIWEERDKRYLRHGGKKLPPFGRGNDVPGYGIICLFCGNKKTSRAKHHSTYCCGFRMVRDNELDIMGQMEEPK